MLSIIVTVSPFLILPLQFLASLARHFNATTCTVERGSEQIYFNSKSTCTSGYLNRIVNLHPNEKNRTVFLMQILSKGILVYGSVVKRKEHENHA